MENAALIGLSRQIALGRELDVIANNMANINTHGFRELWEGEGRRANWQLMKHEFDIKDCRLNCRMNQTNIHLDRVLNGVPHGNFL